MKLELPNPSIFKMYNNQWGNNIRWFMDTGFENRRIVGHQTPGPDVGDLLTCPMDSGKTAVFCIMELENHRNPPDMFFATVQDIGYEDELDDPNIKKRLKKYRKKAIDDFKVTVRS